MGFTDENAGTVQPTRGGHFPRQGSLRLSFNSGAVWGEDTKNVDFSPLKHSLDEQTKKFNVKDGSIFTRALEEEGGDARPIFHVQLVGSAKLEDMMFHRT